MSFYFCTERKFVDINVKEYKLKYYFEKLQKNKTIKSLENLLLYE